MNTTELLSLLRSMDVQLWADGEKLRCSAPRGVLTPAIRKEMADHKAELLAILREAQQSEILSFPSIESIPRDQFLPLSSGQKRLWFLNQLDPSSSAYNIPFAGRIKRNVNIEVLEDCVDEVLTRHEILRSTFQSIDGQPVTLVHPAGSNHLKTIDLHYLPENKREEEALFLVEKEAQQPFDLRQGPLIRFNLYCLGVEDFIIQVVVHHIVFDGWSIGILQREISELYWRFSNNKPSHLQDLPVQYVDFASWQQQQLSSDGFQNQLTYWRKNLSGRLPRLDLPTDKHSLSTTSHKGETRSLLLSKELTQALVEFTHQESATVFMIFLAVLTILLQRLSGEEDIIVGTPIAGRNRPELEQIIGLFLNTLVLRNDLSGNPTFRELLSRIRTTALEAYSNQDVPFEKLVEELQPERSLNRNPIFDVLINFVPLLQPIDSSPMDLSFPLSIQENEAKFPLTLYVETVKDNYNLRLMYQKDLFSSDRMTIFLEQLERILEQGLYWPEKTINSYSLVSLNRQQLFPDARISLEKPTFPLVADWISEWARKTPQHPAIQQQSRTWTYQELLSRSSSIARVLSREQNQQGEVIAISGPKSFGLYASMLGVFLSSGTLLCIDPNLPEGRKQVMLQESNASLILFVGDASGIAPLDQPNIKTLFVDMDSARVEQDNSDAEDENFQLPQTKPEDHAYIFFTSGTTSVPKAILGNHNGLSHFLNWQRETFKISPEDRLAQLTSLSFDVVLRDIFLPLISGATLCIPPGEGFLDPGQILPWMAMEKISVLHIVPSIAETWLMDTADDINLESLRWAFFAGEPLTNSLVKRWHNSISQTCSIVNLYGPTETTLAKFFYIVPWQMKAGVQSIGTSLPQTQGLILSNSGQLCGVGEPGEIVIRTPFRTYGYINNREEQRKRFVANPFRDDPDDLVYYTGDLGRYRPDGSIDILGRLDDQVKIHGVRIDLGEIIAVCMKHPRVKAATVVTRKDTLNQAILAAYILSSTNDISTEIELRRYCAAQLPPAMVPSTFTFLERLPLTPNGKIDRTALPEPDLTRPELAEAYTPPESPAEKVIAEIWAEVLGVEQVGIHDNFFDLGGHSLLATQVVSRIRKITRTDLQVRNLFESPTVAGLAQIAEISQLEERATSGSKNSAYIAR